MKVYIESLSWEFESVQAMGGEIDRVFVGTRIDAEITYPATDTTRSVTFSGTVKCSERVIDMNVAKKIVEDIVKCR